MAGNIKVEGIELEVKTNAGQAAAQVDKLASATRSLSAASSSAEKPTRELSQGLGKTAESAAQAKEATSSSAKEFKKLDTAAKSAASNGLSKIAAAFKRILFYRIVRSAIKEVTQAFAEGMNNAYAYSKAISGPLAKNMDALATSFLYLKNGLGAGLAPIINALTPTVTRLADAVASLGNAVAGFFAMVTGQSTYVKAIKYATQYAEATEGAAKAQRQLLGFDELNVLTDKGGSGGTSLDYSRMFETVDTSTFKNNLENALKDFPKAVSEKMGTAFRNAAEAIRKVNWAELPGKAAHAIKTAFENFDFKGVLGGLGELIGTVIASGIKFTGGFLRDVFNKYILTEIGEVDPEAGPFEVGVKILGAVLKGIGKAALNIGQWALDNIVTPFVTGLKDGFDKSMGPAWEELKFQFRYAFAQIYGWWTLQKEAFFNSKVWEKVFQPIVDAFNFVIENIEGLWDSFKTWLDEHGLGFKLFPQIEIGGNLGTELRNKLMQLLGLSGGTGNSTGGRTGGLTGTGGSRAKPYASGGYPAAGSMFLAGEAGPELVSQVGGRTGVINNDTFGAIVSTAAENIINAVLASGQATAEAAREGGNVYLDKTLVSRALYGSMQSEGTRKGGSAVQFVGV